MNPPKRFDKRIPAFLGRTLGRPVVPTRNGRRLSRDAVALVTTIGAKASTLDAIRADSGERRHSFLADPWALDRLRSGEKVDNRKDSSSRPGTRQ